MRHWASLMKTLPDLPLLHLSILSVNTPWNITKAVTHTVRTPPLGEKQKNQPNVCWSVSDDNKYDLFEIGFYDSRSEASCSHREPGDKCIYVSLRQSRGRRTTFLHPLILPKPKMDGWIDKWREGGDKKKKEKASRVWEMRGCHGNRRGKRLCEWKDKMRELWSD